MKKMLLFGFIFVLLLFTTACDFNITADKEEGENNTYNESIISAIDYTELEIFGSKIKFKMANPTYFWNSDYNFGALEVDTLFMVSENGQEVENYFELNDLSYIIFQTTEDISLSSSAIKEQYKRWYNVDVEVKNLEHDIYKKHIKGENSNVYLEAYAFQYEGVYDGEAFGDVDYSISLFLIKNNYTKEEINKIIAEFHLLIDTLEYVK